VRPSAASFFARSFRYSEVEGEPAPAVAEIAAAALRVEVLRDLHAARVAQHHGLVAGVALGLVERAEAAVARAAAGDAEHRRHAGRARMLHAFVPRIDGRLRAQLGVERLDHVVEVVPARAVDVRVQVHEARPGPQLGYFEPLVAVGHVDRWTGVRDRRTAHEHQPRVEHAARLVHREQLSGPDRETALAGSEREGAVPRDRRAAPAALQAAQREHEEREGRRIALPAPPGALEVVRARPSTNTMRTVVRGRPVAVRTRGRRRPCRLEGADLGSIFDARAGTIVRPRSAAGRSPSSP
jgi:hypothetical protein